MGEEEGCWDPEDSGTEEPVNDMDGEGKDDAEVGEMVEEEEFVLQLEVVEGLSERDLKVVESGLDSFVVVAAGNCLHLVVEDKLGLEGNLKEELGLEVGSWMEGIQQNHRVGS